MSQTPKGLYSRGAGKRQHRPEKPSPFAVYRTDGKLPPKPDRVPSGCVGVQPWGALPAKPPKVVGMSARQGPHEPGGDFCLAQRMADAPLEREALTEDDRAAIDDFVQLMAYGSTR